MINKIGVLILVFFQRFFFVVASTGDRSPFYTNCFLNCMKEQCITSPDRTIFTDEAAQNLDFGTKLLQWGCQDNCGYQCMWKTVDGFKERRYDIPKFHGKWPFKRIFGIQEPGSALASVLNLLMHIYMYREVRRKFSIRKTPNVLFWQLFSVICMHAWMWSTIFHCRDTKLTEFMDYACAFSMVMALMIAAIVRLFHRKHKLTLILVLFPIVYYFEHVRYLFKGTHMAYRINYDYNMIVNVACGVIGSLLWLVWSIVQYLAGRKYAWRMIAFTLLSGIVLSLELFDFPPKYDMWDAHALWHLSTAPLVLLFYRFVIDDLRFLENSYKCDSEDLKKGSIKIT